MRRLALVLSSILLTACAVGPDFTKPDATTPDAFRMAEAGGNAASIANTPWWELLKDQELQKLIRTALEENKDLQRAAAVEEFKPACLSLKQILPADECHVECAAVRSEDQFLVSRLPNPFNYYLQGNLSWEIDIWGRIRRSNEAARGDLLSREESRRAIVLQLVSGVAEAYFELLQFDMQLDIARRTLKSWEESVRIAQARLRQGMISKLDADQFEAERANAAAKAAEFERQKVQKENQLSVLLGRNPGRIARGHSLTEQVMPPDVPRPSF